MNDFAEAAVPSESYLQLRERIMATYPSLSPQLKGIAEFALTNPDRFAVDTVAQLAERIGVPSSSIIRFAQALGYSGFLMLKRTFSDHLMYRAQASDARGADNVEKIGQVGRSIVEARHSLALLEREFDLGLFDAAVASLHPAGNLYVSAQHASFPLASLFVWRMLAAGRQCLLLDNVGGNALRQSQLAGSTDCTLAISFRPYQPSVVEAAKVHHEAGGTIVAITDSQLSPLVPHATVALVVAPEDTSTPFAAVVVITALADAVITRRPSEAADGTIRI